MDVEKLSENFLIQTFLSKNAKFGAKKPILGKFVDKIGILSTCNLVCRNFATVCRNFVQNLQHLM